MIKSKTLFFKFIITALLLITSSLAQAADYSKTLSPQERQNICDSLQAAQTKKSGSDESLDNPIVPNGALLGVYNATRNIRRHFDVPRRSRPRQEKCQNPKNEHQPFQLSERTDVALRRNYILFRLYDGSFHHDLCC